jgi:hypothetical protein
MKRLLLISIGALCLTGCVYPSPYGYSRYTTVTPIYRQSPHYSRDYYVPRPPRFHYDQHEGHRPHFRDSHRHW